MGPLHVKKTRYPDCVLTAVVLQPPPPPPPLSFCGVSGMVKNPRLILYVNIKVDVNMLFIAYWNVKKVILICFSACNHWINQNIVLAIAQVLSSIIPHYYTFIPI